MLWVLLLDCVLDLTTLLWCVAVRTRRLLPDWTKWALRSCLLSITSWFQAFPSRVESCRPWEEWWVNIDSMSFMSCFWWLHHKFAFIRLSQLLLPLQEPPLLLRLTVVKKRLAALLNSDLWLIFVFLIIDGAKKFGSLTCSVRIIDGRIMVLAWVGLPSRGTHRCILLLDLQFAFIRRV